MTPQARDAASLAAFFAEQGKPPPESALAPELFPDLAPHWDAFIVVGRGRQAGMGGPQPLMLSEIEAYCNLSGITDADERAETLRWVQHLDGVYLEREYKRIEQDRKLAEARPSAPRRSR